MSTNKQIKAEKQKQTDLVGDTLSRPNRSVPPPKIRAKRCITMLSEESLVDSDGDMMSEHFTVPVPFFDDENWLKDNYVLVKLKNDEVGSATYIGQIQEAGVTNGIILTNFMRRFGMQSNFSFPTKLDISSHKSSQIVLSCLCLACTCKSNKAVCFQAEFPV